MDLTLWSDQKATESEIPNLLGKHSVALGIRGVTTWEALTKGPRLWLEARKPKASETYVIEGTENRVFLKLANIPLTQEGALAFTNEWGILIRHEWARESWERVDVIHSQAKTMNEGIDHAAAGASCALDLDNLLLTTQLTLLRGKLAGDVNPAFFSRLARYLISAGPSSCNCTIAVSRSGAVRDAGAC